jgi:hypothetical protein
MRKGEKRVNIIRAVRIGGKIGSALQCFAVGAPGVCMGAHAMSQGNSETVPQRDNATMQRGT